MELVDYFFCQTNETVKVTTKYHNKTAVSTITSICEAIEAIYINSPPPNCQSQHINAVNNTHSTLAANSQQLKNSKFLVALNPRSNQLLLTLNPYPINMRHTMSSPKGPSPGFPSFEWVIVFVFSCACYLIFDLLEM